MKKLINRPESCVSDCGKGLCLVHPHISQVSGHSKVFVRSDIASVISAKHVTLLSGGGSGHEPFPVGYIGHGALSAGICGKIFAAPSPSDVLEGILSINSPSGVLVLINNYTGDRLTFGIACEKARALGVRVKMVVNDDDCALRSSDRTAGRRGLSGILFAIKACGAMAEQGHSLDDLYNKANEILSNTGTIGVALGPCSLPGHPANFQMAANSMELGLGLHGEAGIQRTELRPSKETISLMIDHMVDPVNMARLALGKGDTVVVMLNNLGGTSELEMSILMGDLLETLRQRELAVVRCYQGSFVTSLEMHGVLVSVMRIQSGCDGQVLADCLQLLDETTGCFAWKASSTKLLDRPSVIPASTVDSTAAAASSVAFQLDDNWAKLFGQCVASVCRSLVANAGKLDELDSEIGDGDTGSTFRSGAQAVLDNLSTLEFRRASAVFRQLSSIVEQSMGGTSGGVYSLLFTALSSASAGCDGDRWQTLEFWHDAVDSAINVISTYGRAQIGDRTMLDALDVIRRQLADQQHKTAANRWQSFLTGSSKALADLLETCKSMPARAGRSSYVDAGLLVGRVDPGIFAVWLMFSAVVGCLLAEDSG